MSKIIERNTVIPTKKTQEYTTVQDNQAQVNFQIYEVVNNSKHHH